MGSRWDWRILSDQLYHLGIGIIYFLLVPLVVSLVSTTHSNLSAPFYCFWWGKKHVPSQSAFSYIKHKPSPMNLIQDNSCLSWEFVIVKDGFVQTLETGVLEKGCAALRRVPGNMESIINLNSFKQKHNKSPAWLQHQDNFNKNKWPQFSKTMWIDSRKLYTLEYCNIWLYKIHLP